MSDRIAASDLLRFLEPKLQKQPQVIPYRASRNVRMVEQTQKVWMLNGRRLSHSNAQYVRNLTRGQQTASLSKVDEIFIEHGIEWWEFENE